MGQTNSVKKCNFEDIQKISCHQPNHNQILINTLQKTQQTCLITHTMPIEQEESNINQYITAKQNGSIYIFIYGENANDESVYIKYQQLIELGFQHVYVYSGGLFEWLCLQDIYGEEEFPTTTHELDILKFKPISMKKNNLLRDI